ncbi:AraC family transcriptional regulator [Streptomyces sp. NPDC002790]|uniref:AraC family transcriptional regulator n=1 Tax=Streptomyces sp. NPDC002790 TaxID=3154431 RepID=UPI00331E08AA
MDAATTQSLERAAEIVMRHAPDRARAQTLGLRLSHVTAATEPGYQHYTPSLSTVLAGQKRTLIGDDDQVWGRERFIITPVGLPLVSSVVETDPQRGFLAARWQLDPTLLAEVAAVMPHKAHRAVRMDRLGVWSPALTDAFSRLLALLDEPEHIPILGPLISRELVLRLLQTDQAPRVLAALDDSDPIVPRAVSLLTDRMAEPWSMKTLATETRTSQPTLHRRFKEATSMTPMQYLKRLRLGEARHRMVVLGESAAQVALAVGYRSVPHFTRDYRHLYGASPAADGTRLREQLRQGGIDGLPGRSDASTVARGQYT